MSRIREIIREAEQEYKEGRKALSDKLKEERARIVEQFKSEKTRLADDLVHNILEYPLKATTKKTQDKN